MRGALARLTVEQARLIGSGGGQVTDGSRLEEQRLVGLATVLVTRFLDMAANLMAAAWHRSGCVVAAGPFPKIGWISAM